MLTRLSPQTTLPAARMLAEVVALRSGRLVKLPPELAKAAVEQLLRMREAGGEVLEGPGHFERAGRMLLPGEWAIRLPLRRRFGPALLSKRPRRVGDDEVHVYPKYEIALSAAHARWLLHALEEVKPDERDAEGRPLSWVAEDYETEALRAAAENDEDVVFVSGPLSEAETEEAEPADSPLTNDEIRHWFERLRLRSGLPPLALTLTRGQVNKLGFTTGRVWMRPDFTPLRIHLSTCPNADLAEVLATIVHELAHPLSQSPGHGEPFRQAMVELGERCWSPLYFQEARARLGDTRLSLDYWMATGIRAALREAPPPQAKAGDDGQMARIVTKIRKLRELASDQQGRPEAISATATANDLVTLYGLGHYAVRIDARIQEQMVDRWLVFEDKAAWRRTLAHEVSAASEVFSLTVPSKSGLHLFGRHADIVQAEYLYSISAQRIERECDRHVAEWKKRRKSVTAGEVRSERVSFCEAAVYEFGRKLQQIAKDEKSAPERGLELARDFAEREHEKRGIAWGSGGKRTTRMNAAGAELGRSLEFVRGLSSTGGAQRRLTSGG